MKKLILGIALTIIVITSLILSIGLRTPEAVIWNPSETSLKSGTVGAGRQAIEFIAFTPATSRHLEVKTSSPEVTVILRDSTGNPVTPAASSDPTVKAYDLPKIEKAEDWQLEIKNPNEKAPLDYQITVPNTAPASTPTTPVTISPTISEDGSGQTISVSIVVQETIVSVVAPISGAQVTANITDTSNNTVVTIVLQEEDPTGQPGVYTGNFTGNETGGTYQIEYIIDGENSAGEPFVQTTTGEFTIPPGTGSTQTYAKKYDISWSDEVQIIGY